jgi:hypothetical protein
VVCINQPQINRNIRRWARLACETATQYRAVLGFLCDTAEQAEQVARLAAGWLPHHRRMSLERMLAEPRDRARSNHH